MLVAIHKANDIPEFRRSNASQRRSVPLNSLQTGAQKSASVTIWELQWTSWLNICA